MTTLTIPACNRDFINNFWATADPVSKVPITCSGWIKMEHYLSVIFLSCLQGMGCMEGKGILQQIKRLLPILKCLRKIFGKLF